MRAFRSEFIRIWRPAYFYGGFGAMAGFAALISVFIYTAAQSGPPVPSTSPQGPGSPPSRRSRVPAGSSRHFPW